MNETICAKCGSTFLQKGGKGHPKRQFCSDACRQAAYRARTKQQADERCLQLQQEVRVLRERLDLEGRVRHDTEGRHFKAWLRRQPQPRDTDLAKRILADTRLPQQGSHALYVAKMRSAGYSAEEVAQLGDFWGTMLLQL